MVESIFEKDDNNHIAINEICELLFQHFSGYFKCLGVGDNQTLNRMNHLYVEMPLPKKIKTKQKTIQSEGI